MASPIIDAHVHLFQQGYLPARWYESVAERWAASTWPHRDPASLDVEQGLVDPDARLLFSEMDDAGLDGVVCMGLDWGVSLGEPPVPLDEIRKSYGDIQQKSDGRFFGIFGIDPRRPNALEMIHRAIVDDRLRGIKLYPPCGFYPNDSICNPLYGACLELDVPVVLHTAFIGYPHQGHYANPSYIASVQSRFPNLTLVLAHAGHHFWLDEALAVASAHPNTFLDISNWNDLLDTDPTRLLSVLRRMIHEVGAHRILFASDHLGGRRFSGKGRIQRWVDFIDDLPNATSGHISKGEVDLILGGNACRVFGLEEALNGMSPSGRDRATTKGIGE